MARGLTTAILLTLASGASWEESLDRAARTGESLLVEVGATWCHACNVLATRTMADSTVKSELSDGWIVVHVDIDRRPDLHRLFHARGHDGLPTLHLLTSEGREVMRSGFVDPSALVGMLRSARPARPSIGLVPDEKPRAAKFDTDGVADLRAALAAAGDELFVDEDTTWGGFGRGSKYIVSPEMDFLLARSAAGDERAPAALRRFVEAVTASAVQDPVEGGFHRYSETRDWSAPHYEKLLIVQAVMLEALAADARANPEVRAANLAIVRQTWEFLNAELRDSRSGLFFGSLNADVLSESSEGILETGAEFYGRRAPRGTVSHGYDAAGRATIRRNGRRSGPRPTPDGLLIANANARLASALLQCGDVFRDSFFTTHARAILESMQREFSTEQGLLHSRTDSEVLPAALEDIADFGILLLEADAQERSLRLGTRLLDEYLTDDGRLRSRPAQNPGAVEADVGEDGARAIVFLCRLSRATGEERFRSAAQQAYRRLRTARPTPASAAVGQAAQALLPADNAPERPRR